MQSFGGKSRVETGIFDGGPDQSGAGLRTVETGDDVDMLGAVNLTEMEAGRNADAQHLSLARRDGQIFTIIGVVANRGPGAGGVDHGVEGRVFAKRLGGERGPETTDGGPECGDELAGVEGLLGKLDNLAVGTGLPSGVGLKGDRLAGDFADVGEEIVVEGAAQARKGKQLRRIVGVFDGEHTGSSVRCSWTRQAGWPRETR